MATRSQTRIHHFAPFPADATPALISKHGAIHPALFRVGGGEGREGVTLLLLTSFLAFLSLLYFIAFYSFLFYSYCISFTSRLPFCICKTIVFFSFFICFSFFSSLVYSYSFVHSYVFLLASTFSLCPHIFSLLPAFPSSCHVPPLAYSPACFTPPLMAISIPISPPFPSPFSRMHTLSPLYYTTGHTSVTAPSPATPHIAKPSLEITHHT